METLKVQKVATTTSSIATSGTTSAKSHTSGTSPSLSVRFNAGEESIDGLLQSYRSNNNKSSNAVTVSAPIKTVQVATTSGRHASGYGGSNVCTSGGAGDGKNAGVASSSQSLNMKSTSVSDAGVSSTMTTQHQQNVPEELNARPNFLQGNFFSRKSGLNGKQQVSPNHLYSASLDAGIGIPGSGPRSSYSPLPVICGGGGVSSYANGGSSSGISPNSNMILSPNKYRRSISFPIKGATSPVPGYALDAKIGHGIPSLHISNGALTAGAAGGGDAPYLVAGGSTPYNMGNHLDMRRLDHCLNDIIRNMGGADASDNNITAAALLAERMRHQKLAEHHHQRLNEMDVAAIAAAGSEQMARYSRKVFVGGLPPDIDEDEITSSFRRFGPLVVDWPHKAESKSYFPPKGYAFLLFQDENSVQQLIDSCIIDEDKLYLCVSSPTIKDKPVQIRPWRLADADYVLDATMSLDPRKTVFVGGVPRPLKAYELAMIMDHLYGGVCYAGIDTDPELKYPKGAGRVAFSSQQSYIAAISARFVQLQHGDIDKRVEVKPYVLDDQMCDECEGQLCGGKFAPFFCANVICLQYYCERCWAAIHAVPGREYHKPLVKEGADRPRAVPFRWC